MERSDTIAELTKALSKMQGALKSVPKDSTNPFFKMRYASLDAIWDIVRKPLTDNSLCLVRTPKEDYKGKLYLETLLLHSSGEWIKAELPLNAKANDPQSIGSAITYARRYSLSAMLGISADEDDDAEAATDKKPADKPAPKTPPKEPETKGHWCPVHKVNFFMKGKMKAYAHPIKGDDGKDTGEWCHEHKPEPGQMKVEDMQAAREEPPPEISKQFSFEAEYTQANIDRFKAEREKLKLTSEQVQNILGVSGLKAWVQGGHTVDEAITAITRWYKSWAENEKKEVK